MPRIEMYVTTSIADDNGVINAIDDMVACFVRDKNNSAEVEEAATEFLSAHCNALADLDYDVRYCVAIVYIDSESVMSLSYISEDVPENVVPLHSPDWERFH